MTRYKVTVEQECSSINSYSRTGKLIVTASDEELAEAKAETLLEDEEVDVEWFYSEEEQEDYEVLSSEITPIEEVEEQASISFPVKEDHAPVQEAKEAGGRNPAGGMNSRRTCRHRPKRRCRCG